MAEVATPWLGAHRAVRVCGLSLAPAQHPFSLQPPNHGGGVRASWGSWEDASFGGLSSSALAQVGHLSQCGSQQTEGSWPEGSIRRPGIFVLA